MIIKKIILDNFKSHEHTEIDLATGVTTIMGSNGAGKSSIFEAISFALFKQYQSKKLDDLIRTGAKKMTVMVRFTVNGQTYQVARQRSKSSKATLQVREDGEYTNLVTGDTEVTKQIEELLEMDGDLFLNAVYVRQGQIADLIEKSPAEKKEMIGRLLGIDSLERAWKNMKLITEKYEDESLKLEGKLESFTDLDTEITTKQGQITELQGNVKDVKVSLQEAISVYEKVKEEKNVMDEQAIQDEVLSSKIDSISQSMVDTVAVIEDLGSDLESLENVEKEIKEIKTLLVDLDTLYEIKDRTKNLSELLKQNSEINEKIEKISRLEHTIEENKRDHDLKSQLTKNIESDKEVLHEKRTELSNLRVKNQGLEKPLKELEEVKNSCPVCKSKISEKKRTELIAEYEQELVENKEKIKNLLEEVNELNNDLSALEARQETAKINSEKYLAAKGALDSFVTLDELKTEFNELSPKIENENIKINQIKEKIGFTGDLDSEISDLESMKEHLNQLEGRLASKDKSLERLENNKQKLSKLESEFTELREKLEKLDYNKEAHLLLKGEWNSKNILVNSLSEKRHSLSGQLAQIETNLTELESKKATFKDTVDEQKKLKDLIKLLKFIREVYSKDGVQKELRNLSRPLIEAKTRELFEKFNFDYSDIQLDSEYNITVYGPGGDSTLDMISGGEKIAVALALRLAITQVISGNSMELIMLDEPTTHLDEYRRQELIELLKKMSILPQMIIVTHDNALEEAADGIIRLNKEDGNSMVEAGGD